MLSYIAPDLLKTPENAPKILEIGWQYCKTAFKEFNLILIYYGS